MLLSKKAPALKAAIQDQVQSKCRILLCIIDEKHLFQSKVNVMVCSSFLPQQQKHPFPATPQEFTSTENQLNSRKVLGLSHANL